MRHLRYKDNDWWDAENETLREDFDYAPFRNFQFVVQRTLLTFCIATPILATFLTWAIEYVCTKKQKINPNPLGNTARVEAAEKQDELASASLLLVQQMKELCTEMRATREVMQEQLKTAAVEKTKADPSVS